MRPHADPPLILHVIDSLDISGGAEKQLVANLKRFDRELFDHEIAVVKQTEESRAGEVEDLALVHPLFRPDVAPSRLKVVGALREVVDERRPSLIHASLPNSALATRIVSRLDRVPAVESLVNISHEAVRTIDNPSVTMAKLRLHTYLDRLTMSGLAGYHAVSHAVADSWARIVGIDESKIVVIPRGVAINNLRGSPQDRNGARASVLDEFGFDDATLLAISVGRVEPQKGHRYLVEAAAELTRAHPRVRVLIVGRTGTASPRVEKAIEDLDLSDVVHLTGPRRDVPTLLMAADLFVFPSLFEGNGGNAMLEAMAAGLPVITTDSPPMTDLVPTNEYGLLVEPTDSAGLAKAMGRLAGDPGLRHDLGMAGQKRVATFSTPEEVARMHQLWYSQLLGTA